MKVLQILICVAGMAFAAQSGSLVQSAPAGAAAKRNPFEGDEQARRAGAKLYARECASCHGRNREGGTHAPPLNGRNMQKSAPGAVYWVLRNGSLRRGMPSFAHMPEAQRWQIVTFLRGL
jgi:mono/diheme cytochrome c family protein